MMAIPSSSSGQDPPRGDPCAAIAEHYGRLMRVEPCVAKLNVTETARRHHVLSLLRIARFGLKR